MPDLFGVRVLGDHQTAAEHRPAVALRGNMNRKLREIEFALSERQFLYRRVADHHRRNQLAHALGHERHHRLFSGAEGERGMTHVRRRLPERAPAVRQFLEEKRLLARLVEKRAHLGERIDRLVDADQLAGSLELGDPRAHVLGARRGRESHAGSSPG